MLQSIKNKPASQLTPEEWTVLRLRDSAVYTEKIMETIPREPEPIVVQAPPPATPPVLDGYRPTPEQRDEIMRLLKLKKEGKITDAEGARLHELALATGLITPGQQGMLDAIKEQFDLVRARLDKLEERIKTVDLKLMAQDANNRRYTN